jgi:hypothetical protein
MGGSSPGGRIKWGERTLVIYIVATLFLTGAAIVFALVGYDGFQPNYAPFDSFNRRLAGGDIWAFERLRTWPLHGKLAPHYSGQYQMFNYCPFAVFPILFFLKLSAHPGTSFAMAVGLLVLVAGVFLWIRIGPNRVARAALMIAVCTPFPIFYVCERGNIEPIVWLPAAAGIYCFARRRYLAASLLIALAASIKPHPGLLMLLFLPKGRYKEFAAGVGFALLVSVVSLAVIGPTIPDAIIEIAGGFRGFQDGDVLRYRGTFIGNDHSLFALAKQVMRILLGANWQQTLPGAIRTAYPYYALFGAGFLGACLLRLRRLPTLNQVLGITVLVSLVPPVAHDYTLLGIYIPWALLLFALSREDKYLPVRAPIWAMVCCAVLFTPQPYLTFGVDGSVVAQLKTVVLVGLLVIATAYPMPTTLFERNEWPTLPAESRSV